jgi:hypothetical protein
MHSSLDAASNPLPTSADELQISRRAADVAYQSLTIAAMLLLLGSLWVF